ncbi:hypothetical protein CesoFtcFv8_027774 [Champsocephalus esox]|uniref:Uncharacterized protein n=1 Tax=Champsocephalus esox TaxID=159716 RepID=A0AAN8GAT6_9TELE|nr:hypothetical protein CesoFtcFv8_027774 [Champsocephalus esox]
MIRWHADRYENRKYAKRVLMFAIAQPLALSSRPFDVASNLHNAASGANGGERLLGGEESSGCRTHLSAAGSSERDLEKEKFGSWLISD